MPKTKYSGLYRVVHWAIALSFLLLLITIFLRTTWMNKYDMAAIIKKFLAGTDQHLSQDQLVALGKKIRHPMWKWHFYLGYVLTGLFSLRFILPLFEQMKFQSPLSSKLSLKHKLKNWSYIVFYCCVVISLTTGLLLEFGPAEFKHPLEDIHVLGIYYLLAFIVIHLAGVILADYTNDKGIISRIVSGPQKGE